MENFENIFSQYEIAKAKTDSWRSLWQDCYDMALPQRQMQTIKGIAPSRKYEQLFDGTALDAVDQLSASLMGSITPSFSAWFGVKAGVDAQNNEPLEFKNILEETSKILNSQLSRSNFSVEFHQCLLDLIVAGTASMAVEEERIGAFTAFKFTAIPLSHIVLDEDESGRLTQTYRILSLTFDEIKNRYGIFNLEDIFPKKSKNIQEKYEILESIVPQNGGFELSAILLDEGQFAFGLVSKKINSSPYINFRWMKSPAETYGRSPVMKALPDIKTANKVVELILKNASIAVTGLWQAEDDGVLNLANIQLQPGVIIPKAVGSKGLTPLEMPSRFDISQLILNDLRSRIRHALLVDRLPQMDSRKMTATEIIERAEQMNLLLGATYSRIQTEFLEPLIKRLYDILRRRGEIIDLPLDGRMVDIDYRSPIARAQSTNFARDILNFMTEVSALGDEAKNMLDIQKTVKLLAESLALPPEILKAEIKNLEGEKI